MGAGEEVKGEEVTAGEARQSSKRPKLGKKMRFEGYYLKFEKEMKVQRLGVRYNNWQVAG